MSKINKVTTLFPTSGEVISNEAIQVHIDAQNADGYYLVGVDNLKGWYRFFWEKEVE